MLWLVLAALDHGGEEEEGQEVKAEHLAEGHLGGTGGTAERFNSSGIGFPGRCLL